MKVFILTLISLSLLLGSNVVCVLAWSEIAQIPHYLGTAPNVLREKQTANFTCSHEWRIIWNYTPISIVDPANVYFNIFIYRTNETNWIIEMNQQGNTTTSGTWYINNQTGEFYLKFLVYNVLDSAAVIEEDIGSIPEFSPMFPLSVFTVGTLAAAVIARKRIRFRYL